MKNIKSESQKYSFIFGSDSFSDYLTNINTNEISDKDKLIIYQTIIKDKYAYIYYHCNKNIDDTHNIIIDSYIAILEQLNKYIKNIPKYTPQQRQTYISRIINNCISTYYSPLETGEKTIDATGKYVKKYAKKITPQINDDNDDNEIDVWDYLGFNSPSAEERFLNQYATTEELFDCIFSCSNCCTVERQFSYLFARIIFPEIKGTTAQNKSYINDTYNLLYGKKMNCILNIFNSIIYELYYISLNNLNSYKEFTKRIQCRKDKSYCKSPSRIRDDCRYIKHKLQLQHHNFINY